MKQYRNICMIIAFVLLLSFFNVHVKSEINDGLLVFTAYLSKVGDQHSEFYSQQALIMYDLDKRYVSYWTYIPDGCLVCADLKDDKYVYVVGSQGYGMITNPFYNYVGSCNTSISKFLITDNGLQLIDKRTTAIGNNSFIIGIDDWLCYLIEYSSDYEFKIFAQTQYEGITEICDIGHCFDEWTAWTWPCDFMSINSEMYIALLRYDSWGDENTLQIYDLKEGNMLQEMDTDISGPLCWVNERALLTWECLEDDKYCACLYDFYDDTLTKLFASSMIPVYSSNTSNNKVVYWAKDEQSLSIKITCFDGTEETLITLYADEEDSSYSTYFTDSNRIVYQISVPDNLYQPTVLLVQ